MPVVAADSFASIYLPPLGDLTGVAVRLGDRQLPVIYAGNNQVNVLVPAGVAAGTYSLTVGVRFFGTIPVPVDVVDRWPGLASAALNENGTVNSEANPAARGTVVSLFGSGFGPLPLPVVEPFILATGVTAAQGMEVLFAGLLQVNARVPANAVPGHTPVRVVIREPNGLVSSNLARIWIR